jgi:hypothetical protein
LGLDNSCAVPVKLVFQQQLLGQSVKLPKQFIHLVTRGSFFLPDLVSFEQLFVDGASVSHWWLLSLELVFFLFERLQLDLEQASCVPNCTAQRLPQQASGLPNRAAQ